MHAAKKLFSEYFLQLLFAFTFFILLTRPSIPALAQTQTQPGSTCPLKSSGDANCDGRIDDADFVIIQNEIAGSDSGLSGDLDGSGKVDLIDYEIWRRTVFTASGPTPTFPVVTLLPTSAPLPTIPTGIPQEQITPTDLPVQPTVTPPSVTISPLPPSVSGTGIWISRSEIQNLPASGPAWDNVKAAADTSAGIPDLTNQDDTTGVITMAKALVYTRVGGSQYLNSVQSSLQSIVNSGTYNGRALALGRELAAYVISADIIDLQHSNPGLDAQFRQKIHELLNTATSGGPANLIQCHEQRPNNWGAMCGASRIAVDLYLGDKTDLDRAAQVAHGWFGDRTSYAGFQFGAGSDVWMCDPANPRPVNPLGCTKDGHDLSGAPVDDVRRGGGYMWPPTPTDYAWGGFSGAVAQAEMLYRAGFHSYDWENQAVRRGMQFLATAMPSSQSGPTDWLPFVVNFRYRTNFQSSSPVNLGRLVGWTDWTHAR